MDIYRIDNKHIPVALPFWADSQETMVWSALQGHLGSIWVDSLEQPTCSRIVIADFMFLAGELNRKMISHRPEEYGSSFIIMIPDKEDWNDLIERYYDDSCTRCTRYAIRKEPEIFDRHTLRNMVSALDTSRYALQNIEDHRDLYETIRNPSWTCNLAGSYPTYEEYCAHGIGCAITCNGRLVSCATSYTHYSDGIEMELDTHPEYRRLGLASVCAAALILRCLDRGLYPSWDAANKISVAISEKLGYHYDHEYTAYQVTKYGS